DLADVTIRSFSTLDLSSNSETIGSLSGGGIVPNVFLGTGGLTVGGNNASTIYDGNIGGSGMLTKVGAGTFTLTGASLTGTTTINAGTLLVNGSMSGSPIVLNGGILGGGGPVGTITALG